MIYLLVTLISGVDHLKSQSQHSCKWLDVKEKGGAGEKMDETVNGQHSNKS